MLKENKARIEAIRSNAKASIYEQREGKEVSLVSHADIANLCDAILDLAQGLKDKES